jgi:hypothetical protein
MSESDAVPLPREGEVFFDVRGEARTMRLSWYADSKVAVFSIWQGNRCTGTFRLPFAELARMVQTLQSGPPMPASPRAASYPPQGGASGYPEPSYSDPGYGGDRGYGGYGDEHPYQPYAGDQAFTHAPGQTEPGSFAAVSYPATQNFSADQNYGADQDYGPGPLNPGYAATSPYGYLASGASEGGQQPGYSLPDYDPPYYNEPPRYASADPAATSGYRSADSRGVHRRPSPSDEYGDLGSNRSQGSLPQVSSPLAGEPESVPDPAMLSFPSVPARNGPGSYR